MKNTSYLLSVFLLTILLLSGHWVKAAHLNEGYYQNQIYLALKPHAAEYMIDGTGQVNMDLFLTAFESVFQNVEINKVEVPFFQAKDSPLENVIQVFVGPGTDLSALCNTLGIHAAVAYAERVPQAEFFESVYPNDLSMDSNYSGQWYLHKIQAPEAWRISRGSRDIKVAVVDQAIDIEHPDLKDVIWTNPGEIPDNGIDDDENGYVDDVHGYDVAEDDPDPNPDNAQQVHGTHVAGLVSAKTDNNIGIASIGYNLSIIPVKSAYSNNAGAEQYKGVIYAANTGADIINCSWGGAGFSITNKNVIEFAQREGALVVCSSGNEGSDELGYPAAYTGVITVGATTILDRMSSFSNYNEKLSVSSPGSNIISTLPGDKYESYSGTSMSTPIVSGLLGLMKSHYPEISNDELKTCLVTTTDPVDVHLERYAGKTGTGRINAYKAMLCVDALKKSALGVAQTEEHPLRIFPNPSEGIAYLESDFELTSKVNLQVTDLLGRVLLNRKDPKPLSNRIQISTSDWAAGIYLIELQQGKNLWRGKLTVR